MPSAWPGAELIIIEDSGHTGSTIMTGGMHAAADRLYEQITNPPSHTARKLIQSEFRRAPE